MLLSEEFRAFIEGEIALAEENTSAEIRVHLDEQCPEVPLDRAAYLFARLEMHRTALRNGVLVYISVEDRKVAILGDIGIHQKVGAAYWNAIVKRLIEHFKNGQFEIGMKELIATIGDTLKLHFPVAAQNPNELSNKTTTQSQFPRS